MKTAIKQLSTALLSCIITMTLLLSPIPGIQSSDAIAQSSEEQKPGIYKPGEKFNEDLTKKTKFKDHTEAGGDGVMKLIEQYVGALFAVVGLSLISVPRPEALASCPTNQGKNITFPLIQAGSVAYLAGEIMANEQFKKGSKIAVDHNFAEKKDENVKGSKKLTAQNKEANRKQIKAFESLEKIYQHQVKGMQTKVNMVMASEVAFGAAFGVELSNMLQIKTTGEAHVTAFNTAHKAFLVKIKAAAKALAAEGKVYASVPDPTTATKAIAAACFKGAAEMTNYGVQNLARHTTLTAEGTAQTAQKKVTITAKIAKLAKDLAASAMAAVNTAVAAVKKLFGVSKVESTTDTGLATTNDTKQAALLATSQALVKAMEVSLAVCPASGKAAIALVETFEAFKLNPMMCTGVQSHVTLNAYTPIPAPGATNIEEWIDDNLHLTPLAAATQEKKKFYVKLIMENFLHNIAKLKIESQNFDSYESKLKAIASTSNYVDYVVEEQMNYLNSNEFIKEMESEIKFELAQGHDINSLLKVKMTDLRNLIVQDAHAFDFKTLLNVGGKIIGMYFFLNGLLHDYAFPTPKSRTYTWGAMTALNTLILMHDMKALKEAKARLKRVKEEKEKFLNSSARKTELAGGQAVDLASTTKSSNSALASDYDATDYEDSNACFQKAGEQMEQIKCSNKKTKDKIKLKTLSNGGNVIAGGQFLNATAQLSDITSDIANGEALKNSNVLGGKIGKLQETRNAIMSRNEELVKSYDELDLKGASDKEKAKASTLERMIANFKNDYMKNSSTPISSGSLAGLKPQTDKEEKKKKVAVTNIPKFDAPEISIPDFNETSLDDLSNDSSQTADTESNTEEVKKEENLADFDVDHNDINENEGVSIFKLISNRYLKSYSTFLEVKKKKKQ